MTTINYLKNTYVNNSLVQPLPDGPLDIVGDVHGEIDALKALLRHLGYHDTPASALAPARAPGSQPPRMAENPPEPLRRLVFVGDLIDRGPDSVAVVRLIRQLIDSGRALAVMGNHDLNAVLGTPKAENGWFFGHRPPGPPGKNPERAVRSDEERQEILALLRGLPLALERGDLRVVHAAWDEEAIDALRGASTADLAEIYNEHVQSAKALAEATDDPVERTLILQNHNPVKRITSGPEQRADKPFEAAGKLRYAARAPWWDRQGEGPMCVIGHYSRTEVQDHVKTSGLFGDLHPYAAMGPYGNVACIDYSVGYRHRERLAGVPEHGYVSRLAALRWPERELVFDNGQRNPLESPRPRILREHLGNLAS